MEKNNTIIGSALLVMIVSLASKLLGFVRQMVIAASYGSNTNTDIFFVSSEFMLGLSGALLASLTTALVTIYIDTATKKDRASANAIASKMLTLFLLASGAFILIINLFAPQIAKILAPSYTATALTRLVTYLRFFSAVFIFTAFQSIYAAVLNANNSFVPGKLYGIVYNPTAIIFVLLFSQRLGTGALVLAFLVGNIGQTLLLKRISKNIFSFHPSVDFKDGAIKNLVLLSLPLLISNIFMQLNGIVDKSICSILGEGIASNYSYAYTLEQFVTATITVTLSIVLLSRYATYVAQNNTQMVIKTFRDSLCGLILLLAPITVVAGAMSYEIVSIVYLRGQFDTTAALFTSHALIGFCIGFIPVAIREMYIRLHLAYQDTKTPMRANIAAVILNAVLSIILAKYFGIIGISFATSISVILTVIILNKSAKRYIPDFKFFSIGTLLIKTVIASVLSLVVIILLKDLLKTALIVRFIICATTAIIVYIVSLIIMRCSELRDFITIIRSQIMNKINK